MILFGRSSWSKFVIAAVYLLLAWSSSSVSAYGSRAVTQSNTRRGVSSALYRFGRFLPGMDSHERESSRLYARSGPSASASASPAPSPTATATSTSVQGSIQVRALNSTELGYLMNTPQGLNGVTTNQTDKLSVTLDISKSSLAPVDITAQNPKFPGPNKLGGIALASNASSSNLAVGSNNAVLLSNVPQTAPGSRPVSSSQGAVESAIWTLNQGTGELTAHWINSNGQSPATFIAYNQNNNTLYLTGEQPSPSSNGTLIPVALFFDPNV